MYTLGLLNYWDEISQSYKEFPVLQGTPVNPYPVGSIYMSIAAASPAELFGGTWERIMDKFLIGASDTYVPETEGGEVEVVLSIDMMPSHGHIQNVVTSDYNVNPQISHELTGSYRGGYNSKSSWATTGSKQVITQSTGGGAAHNNLPPYLAVYIWQRIE